jgi:sugar lactone lactonase YvrE
MQKLKASLLLKTDSILGEGPAWHEGQQRLYWVDIKKMQVHCFEPRTNNHLVWSVGKKVGAVVPATNGNLILALQGEIAELDIISGTVTTLKELESHIPENRCNDGKCDAAGRFWIGTMNNSCKPCEGSLYCIDRALNVNSVLTELSVSNGMGWSLNGNQMYFIDTADHNVKRFDFHRDEVTLRNEQVILRFEDTDESPDGMCVDSEGMLWIAFWCGKRVGRYDPVSGKQLAEIEVPALNVTSCCFGGDDLATLYITTAREELSASQLEDYPLSGSLFSCKPGVKGLNPDFFVKG